MTTQYTAQLRELVQSILAGVQALEDADADTDDDIYAGITQTLRDADEAVHGTVDWIQEGRNWGLMALYYAYGRLDERIQRGDDWDVEPLGFGEFYRNMTDDYLRGVVSFLPSVQDAWDAYRGTPTAYRGTPTEGA